MDTLALADLRQDPRNARRRTPRSKELLDHSLSQYGAARSIVIDENGQILAGNGTVEAAAAAGITKVQVVDADGDTLIAVRRSDLSAAEKIGLALADNRTADLAEWDVPQLEAIGADVPDILGQWFTAADMAQLTDEPDDTGDDEREDDDTADPDDGDPTMGQPLAIVLSPQEFRLWRQAKDQLGYSTDRSALLKLAQDFLDQVQPRG
jgi:hypothetical protein